MRIRKRFPPPSDPQLNHSVAAVQHLIRETPLLQPPSAATTCCSPPPSDPPPPPPPLPSDQPAPIRTQNPRWVFSGCDSCQRKMEQKELEEEVKDEDERITTGSNDSKKEGISSAHQDSSISQPFSSLDQGRWCGGEREVPLKKRRGGFEKYVVGKETMRPKMKSKTNKKCVQENGNDGDDDDHGAAKNNKDDNDNNDHDAAKKSKRGSEIVEGSRCSRVNGRGWRCCQQTLVGYSLCEHHLGKGRLRSVNAVRNRRMGESKNNKTDESAETSCDSSKEKPLLLLENVDDDNERKKPSMMSSKKRMKIGMVKARSISSLLGQTDNLVATKAAENEDEMRVN